MNTSIRTQFLPNYRGGEEKTNSSSDSSIEINPNKVIDCIQKILQMEDMHPDIADLCQNILKKYAWNVEKGEPLPRSIQLALNCFVRQDPEGIEELIEWSNHALSLDFFIEEWTSKNELITHEQIEDFFKKTSPFFLLDSSYSDREIRNYTIILINHFARFESHLSEMIPSFANYLSRKNYIQLPLVVQSALEINTSYARDFIESVITENLISSYCRITQFRTHFSTLKPSIENALEQVLLTPSHDYNILFIKIFSTLLVINETSPLITRILNQLDSGFFSPRLTGLLEKIIDEEDEHQSQRIDHFLRIILTNKKLFQHFKESAKSEKFIILISRIYQWEIFPDSIQHRLSEYIFNPFFHFHIERFICLPKNDAFQLEILHIFLNLIQSQTHDLIEEFKGCGDCLKDTSELFKICIARFNCEITCNRQLKAFLEIILNYVKSINEKSGPIGKKLELTNKVLNACLEVQIEHIEKIHRNERIVKFFRDITTTLPIRSTLENFEISIQAFEKSFPHLLFRTLYSSDEFKEWFNRENSHLSREEKTRWLTNMTAARRELESTYGHVLQRNNFNSIHNNQIAALMILKRTIAEKNLFLKLGTGQGKSLIAEMAAIHLLNSSNPPERVFIFTSYDHLAKRDCEEMQFLSEVSGFSSIYISSQTLFSELTDLPQKKIIHIDSLNFIAFLVKNFQEAMEKGENISDLVNIFLRPERCAAILDEGDLLTLDDPRHGYIYEFPRIFGNQNIDMKTQKGLFDEMIGQSLIRNLNTLFPGSYEKWYRDKAQDNRVAASGTNQASGKVFNYAASFSNNVGRGIYQFYPLSCNFSSFVRSFRDVLFLSGSITQQNMSAFNSYFTNGKENLYVDIPLFYGPHNQNSRLTEQIIIDQCNDTDWHQHILRDVAEAMQHRRPILLFALSGEKLKEIKEILTESSICNDSRYNWITITNESELKCHVSQIGNSQTITLATAICGRGIDIKPTKAVESGLHVLITELPENDNERLLIQMKGRTARMDRKGSFSLIVKGNYRTFERNAELKREKSMSDNLKLMDRKLEISRHFFNRFHILDNPQRVKNWLVFLNLIENQTIDLNKDEIYGKAKDFLTEL